MGNATLEEALQLSRDGRVEEAATKLREAGASTEAERSLLFQLSSDGDEKLVLAGAAIESAKTPLQRSNWALRRGLLHLERLERDAALADLQLVLKLKANDGHVEQARVALLRVAQIPKN
jgi:hypothetical protein